MSSRTSSIQSSPITESDNTTGLARDLFAESLFRMPTIVQRPEPKETDAATLDYYNEGIESSTSQQVDSGKLEEKATVLFASAKDQIFEDGMESNFSRELVEFVKAYGHSAMEIIIRIVLSDRINFEIVSEALRVIGRIHHPATCRERLWLLESGLYSSSARVRDGAVVGLAYLDDPIAITPLGLAIKRESVTELRQDMEQVLSQLEDTQKWRSS